MVLKNRFNADWVWSCYVTYLSIWLRPRHPCLVVPLCRWGTMAHVTGHLGHSSLRQSLFLRRSILPSCIVWLLGPCQYHSTCNIAAGIFGNDCYRVFLRILLAKVRLGKLWHTHPWISPLIGDPNTLDTELQVHTFWQFYALIQKGANIFPHPASQSCPALPQLQWGWWHTTLKVSL